MALDNCKKEIEKDNENAFSAGKEKEMRPYA